MFLRVLWYCFTESRAQWLAPAKLRRLQEKRLRAIVRHAYEHVPLYREKFDAVGVTPADIKTLDDLPKLPFVTKQEIWAGMPEKSLATNYALEDYVKRSTSGTSGGPMPIFYDKRYLDYYIANKFYRMPRATGFTFGDRLLEIYYSKPEPRLGAAGRGNGDRVPRTSLGNAALGRVFALVRNRIKRIYIAYSAEEIVADILAYRPTRIYALGSYLRLLAETAADARADGLRPKSLMSWGEVLDEPTRAFLEASFGCPVYNHYGIVELGAFAWECERRQGFHVTADSVVVEVVRGGEPVSPGERGEIVVTGLLNEAMPLIRYRVGDVGVLGQERCPCGRSFPLLSAVEGRLVDCFRLPDGRLVTPLTLMTAIQGTPGVSRYQAVQVDEKHVTIELMRKPSDPDVAPAELIGKCQEILGDDVAIAVRISDRTDLKAKFRPVISKLTVHGEPRWTTPRAQPAREVARLFLESEASPAQAR